MCKRTVFLMIITLLFISESYSQRKDGGASIGIGPQIGFQQAGDADEGRFMFGGFLRLKLSDAFAVEGSVNYRTEQYAKGRITVRSWPVLVSGLIYPIPIIYGIVGAGWYHSTFDFEPIIQQIDIADQTQTRFGFHVGGGVELPLGESVKLIGDIKYVFLDYDWEDLGDTPLNDFNSNFYIINVGIAFGLR